MFSLDFKLSDLPSDNGEHEENVAMVRFNCFVFLKLIKQTDVTSLDI